MKRLITDASSLADSQTEADRKTKLGGGGLLEGTVELVGASILGGRTLKDAMVRAVGPL